LGLVSDGNGESVMAWGKSASNRLFHLTLNDARRFWSLLWKAEKSKPAAINA
jgi:hypothetical protein